MELLSLVLLRKRKSSKRERNQLSHTREKAAKPNKTGVTAFEIKRRGGG